MQILLRFRKFKLWPFNTAQTILLALSAATFLLAALMHGLAQSD